MSVDIWTACNGANHVRPLFGDSWRIEELTSEATLHHISSSVDILADLISEHEKRSGLFVKSRYKSRFRESFDPPLLYASMERDTCLAECAFYHFLFKAGQVKKRDEPLTFRYALYSIPFDTKSGLDLTVEPFLTYRDLISSPSSYEHSIRLGGFLIEAGIEAFIFWSARREGGKNIAFSSENALQNFSMSTWVASAKDEQITFFRAEPGPMLLDRQRVFKKSDFMINDVLPFPG